MFEGQRASGGPGLDLLDLLEFQGATMDLFLVIFGCTELKIGPSRAKKSEEFDFEVRLPVQPPKLAQKGETSVSRPKNVVEKKKIRRKLN